MAKQFKLNVEKRESTGKLGVKELRQNKKIPGVYYSYDASNLLFQIDELTKFKKFSLWSEHLILHSSLSLKKFINAAGYSKIKIIKFQRFGLSNHIGWILDQAPGGQKKYDKYIPSEFEQKYKKNLLNKNLYDTLIVVATNEKKS